MSSAQYHIVLVCVISAAVGVVAGGSKHRPEAYACQLLNTKFVESQPWLEYPILFGPIHRGRLTIWSGMSSLPGSEFRCYSGQNGTGEILLDFSDYVDKLEWTYHDSHRRTTSHGVSVSHREGIVYKVHVDNRQMNNPLECNRVDRVDFSDPAYQMPSDLKTTCRDCKRSTVAFVNSQISELLKGRLNANIMDGLHWHLTQLVSNRRFSPPLPF